MDGLLQYTLWWNKGKGEGGNAGHGDGMNRDEEFGMCMERGEYYLAFICAMKRLVDGREEAL